MGAQGRSPAAPSTPLRAWPDSRVTQDDVRRRREGVDGEVRGRPQRLGIATVDEDRPHARPPPAIYVAPAVPDHPRPVKVEAKRRRRVGSPTLCAAEAVAAKQPVE